MLLLEGAELMTAVDSTGKAEGRVYPEEYIWENAPYANVGPEKEGTVGRLLTAAASAKAVREDISVMSDFAGLLPSIETASNPREKAIEVTAQTASLVVDRMIQDVTAKSQEK